jgi:hypothetical protein
MQKSIVLSENIGRWIDLDELDADSAQSEPVPKRHEFVPFGAARASHGTLRFQPFRELAARLAAPLGEAD